MPGPRDSWREGEQGPFVRPYAVTRGRTVPAGDWHIGLIDVVVAVHDPSTAGLRLGPEHRQLLARCLRPMAVVDLASEVDLPVGVVRVLLSDLSEHGIIRLVTTPRGRVTSRRLLSEVLDGLRAL